MTSQARARWIESINSFGPFNHSPWEGRGIRVSHEEDLDGRAMFLAETLRRAITSRFGTAELKRMTIVDVGCYDGWILHQLSDLPFKKLVGIEPRAKNIAKGKGVRKLLGVKTRVKFRIGDLSTLGKQRFDIVVCVGVLHHVESAAQSLKALDAITKQMLMVDTICLPAKYLTEEVGRDLELKDVIYQMKPRRFGLTGEKYESSYYDGSAAHTAVVQIPSIESLKMNLDLLGYDPVSVVASPSDFRRALTRNKRPFDEVLLVGTKVHGPAGDDVAVHLREYERALCLDPLPNAIIRPLYEQHVQETPAKSGNVVRLLSRYIAFKADAAALRPHFPGGHQFEIAKNLRFNPRDKISFEYAKTLFNEGKDSDALVTLRSITERLNADWRAVYRSFYVMSLIHERRGDAKQAAHYAKLCKRCHASFPLLTVS